MSPAIQRAVSPLHCSHPWIVLALICLTTAASLLQLNSAHELVGTKGQRPPGFATTDVFGSPPRITGGYTADESSVSTKSSNRRDHTDGLPNKLFRPLRDDHPPLPTFPKSTMIPSEGDIPPYMMDVLNEFSLLNGKRPKANIVRSFLDQGEQCYFDEDQMNKGTNHQSVDQSLPNERTLLFNVTIPIYETLDTAELRLFLVMDSTSTQSGGAIAKISVYYDNGVSFKQISVRTIYRLESGWESFLLTDFVRNRIQGSQLFKRKASKKSGSLTLPFRVRIESAFFPYVDNMSSQIKIDCSERIEYKTLLAIYSNDANSHRRTVKSEGEKTALFRNEEIATFIKRKAFENNLPEARESLSNSEGVPSAQLDVQSNFYDLPVSPKINDRGGVFVDSVEEDVWGSDIKNGDEPSSNFVTSNDDFGHNRYRTKRAARNYCRRIPMEVDFQKIEWDTWVKFPKKYQAYKCVGKCFHPITSNWSPSNHALVQSRMHMYDRSVNRPCCVPVEFGSISMMYLNENNVLTFKYDYRDMTVRACGCQ